MAEDAAHALVIIEVAGENYEIRVLDPYEQVYAEAKTIYLVPYNRRGDYLVYYEHNQIGMFS